MKCIALILAILITVPPVLNSIGYIIDNEGIALDENFGEEEKEERESTDSEEKDKELNLDELALLDILSLDKISLLDCFDNLMLSQNYTKDHSPPPEF